MLSFVHADGRVRAVASDLHFANGMEMVGEGETLLVAETRSTPPRISSFDVAPDGSLRNRRVFAEFEGARMPDGIAVLPQGEVLVAMPFSSEVVLVSSAGDVAKAWSTSSIGMPFAVAVNANAGEMYVACSSSWEEEKCLAARDSVIVRMPLR